jgi:DNA modification methylase
MSTYAQPGTAQVIHGNALALPIASESIDLIVTSPPYFSLRSYKDSGEHYDGQIGAEEYPEQYLKALWASMSECWRVLKPTGSCWINLGDKYASGRSAGNVRGKSLMGLPWSFANGCIGAFPFSDGLAAPCGQSWILRAEVIWDKPNGLPENVTDRVRRNHEQWFHFTKQSGYFAAIDNVRVPHSTDRALSRRIKKHGTDSKRDQVAAWTQENPLGKLPSSVWSISTEPLQVPEELGITHLAAFPMSWPIKIIQGWAPEGGVVLDPFGGTGTTALVAKALGRHGISIDLSNDYCRLAEWRINDARTLSKVRDKSNGLVSQASVVHESEGQFAFTNAL